MSRLIKIIMACFMVAAGIVLLRHAQLVTGGTAGLALSLSYMLHMPFYALFFLLNIPFYLLSIMRMGWNFTLSTLFSVSFVTFISAMDHWLPQFVIPGWFGSIIGGGLIGSGLSMLFLNKSSLGGANILALYLQGKFGWDPGKFTFAFDFVAVAIGIYSVGLGNGFYSICSIFIISTIISYFKGRIANAHTPVLMKLNKPVA